MRTRLPLVLILGLLLALVQSLATAQGTEMVNGRAAVANEILVKMRPGLASAALDAVHARIGGRLRRHFAQAGGWQEVTLPAGMSVAQALTRYRTTGDVIAVEPNYLYHADAQPNDPQMSQLWGLTKIGAPAAWDNTTGSQTIVVGVVDTGVNYNHEDLRANIWRNPGEVAGNRVDDDGNGYVDDVYGIDAINGDSDPLDDAGHGTHVAGTIGAAGNNALGVAGINWTVKILPLKFLGANGSGSTSGAIACYNYAIALKRRGVDIRVMNNSWSGNGFSQSLKDAIDAAANVGILSVAAAGNSGTNIDSTPAYPAAFASAGVIAVAASDQYDNPASFTNYGATKVHLAAPGVAIQSTYYASTSSYASMSGTSMATPHVAGAAALLCAKNPALTVAGVKSLLLSSVDKLAAWNGKVSSGGRMNLARAMQNAGGTVTSPPSSTLTGVSLTASPTSPQPTGKAITLTAAATGGAAEYEFRVGSTLLRSYSTANTVLWTPATAGSYTVTVHARTVGSTTTQVSKSLTYTVTAPTKMPLTGVTLNVTPASPPPVGTAVTLSASATGGAAEYRFMVGYQTLFGWQWTTLQAYGPGTTVSWRPTTARTYTVVVHARALGSTTASYEVYKSMYYTVR